MRLTTYLYESNLTYEEYVTILESYDKLDESLIGLIPGIFQELKDTMQEIVEDFKVEMSDIIDALKNKEVFRLLKTIGFRTALKAFRSFSKLISAPVSRAFKELHDTKMFQSFRENRDTIREFLDRHPVIKKLSGIALAGLLLYIWFNMTFIGALQFDMDLSDVVDAIRGTYTIEHFLTSPDIVKYIVLFLTGFVGGFSVAWLGHSIYNLILAITYTFYKKNKPQLVQVIQKKIVFA
jgi:hypothetical protein